jgi:DnaJ domain
MARAPFDPSTDYYQLLGVTSSATPEQIQAAYRRLAKAYHPDLNAGSKIAAARMARVNAAKSVLLDAPTRASYDQQRATRRHAVARVATAAHPPVRTVPAHTPRYRQSAVRVGPRPPRRGSLDRGTGVLLLIILPLLGALLLYVFEAVQLAGQPLRALPGDLALSASSRPTTRNTAEAVFYLVHAQPPSTERADAATRVIASRRDGTPEGELLRAAGRQLVQAGRNRDTEAWQEAVAEVCVLANRC